MLRSSIIPLSLLLLLGVGTVVFRGEGVRLQVGCTGVVSCKGGAKESVEATLPIRRQGHCQNIPGAQELFIRNTHPSKKMVGHVKVTNYLEPGHIPNGGGGPPPDLPINLYLYPGQQSEGLSCTFYNDLRDINNPKLYSREFEVTVEYEQPQDGGGATGGGPTCSTSRAPTLGSCQPPQNPALRAGYYRIQSTNYHFTEQVFDRREGNTTRYRVVNVPICINKTNDFQQLRCAYVPDQTFYFGPVENGCYVFKDHSSSGNFVLADPGQDDRGVAKLLGLGSTQIANCPFDQARFHWQLRRVSGDVYEIKDQATGKCLQINADHIKPEGEINAIRCRRALAEQWTLTWLGP